MMERNKLKKSQMKSLTIIFILVFCSNKWRHREKQRRMRIRLERGNFKDEAYCQRVLQEVWMQ
jgi:hypothetical protein